MALIIKGDMPKDCFRCDELVTMSLCPINLNEPLKYCNGERHPDCPILGEIPDEHGELIERSKVHEAITQAYCLEDVPSLIDQLVPTVLEVSSSSEIPNNWHTGTPPDPLSLYLVLWFDTEDRVYRYSVLNWHDKLNCWYDEETPDSLWGDEYKAKVLLWLPIGTPIRAARQLLEAQQKGQ